MRTLCMYYDATNAISLEEFHMKPGPCGIILWCLIGPAFVADSWEVLSENVGPNNKHGVYTKCAPSVWRASAPSQDELEIKHT